MVLALAGDSTITRCFFFRVAATGRLLNSGIRDQGSGAGEDKVFLVSLAPDPWSLIPTPLALFVYARIVTITTLLRTFHSPILHGFVKCQARGPPTPPAPSP